MEPQYTLTQASFGEAGTHNRPSQKCEFYLDKINFNGKKQVTVEVDAIVYTGTKDEIIHKAFTNILLLVAGMVSGQEGNPGDMDRIYQELEKRYLPQGPSGRFYRMQVTDKDGNVIWGVFTETGDFKHEILGDSQFLSLLPPKLREKALVSYHEDCCKATTRKI